MFSVITYKSNTGQFLVIFGNDLKLIPRPSNEKSLSTPLCTIFFHCLSLLSVKDLELDFSSPLTKKTSYALAVEKAAKTLFEWFENNLLKNNAHKCHLSVSSSDAVSLRVSECDIKNSECEKLLGVKFDKKLKFEKRITGTCRKASRKIYEKNRSVQDLSKRRMAMNAFFNSQFNYCPPIWMCRNHMTNRKINRLHKRCLRIIYNDKQLSFKMLLEKR